jgi:elongator complex protein 1
MVAYEKALEWQELFELAARTKLSEDDINSMGYRIAGSYVFY